MAWAEGHGRLITDPDKALPGDHLVLKGGSSGYKHVGIVTEEPDAQGRFPTAEGNTNEAGGA